ncbi:GntR family transcriptional regulator [Paracoccus marinus]|nr:GntR family transcriptional regulator [Paracoccus marinus]
MHYGAARATVSRAMRELADDGIVERRRKTGTRVRLSPIRQARFGIPVVKTEIEEAGAAYRYALVRSEIVPPPDFLRARMSLPAGADVRHLICMHFSDGSPYQFEDRWINLDAVPDAREADFAAEGPNEWLVRQVPFTRAEISFSATDATLQQAQHLDCNPGDALFSIERQTEWEGRAVTFVKLVYRRGHRMTTRY